jgi:hypothetical protein
MSEVNVKHASILDQAQQLKAKIEHEEELILKLLDVLPVRRVLIKVPTARQWKYEYQKRYGEHGVATVRFILLTVGSLSGKKAVFASAGPQADFLPMYLKSFDLLLERMGGFESLLNLIGDYIDQQIKIKNEEHGDGQAVEKVDALLEIASGQK